MAFTLTSERVLDIVDAGLRRGRKAYKSFAEAQVRTGVALETQLETRWKNIRRRLGQFYQSFAESYSGTGLTQLSVCHTVAFPDQDEFTARHDYREEADNLCQLAYKCHDEPLRN